MIHVGPVALFLSKVDLDFWRRPSESGATARHNEMHAYSRSHFPFSSHFFDLETRKLNHALLRHRRHRRCCPFDGQCLRPADPEELPQRRCFRTGDVEHRAEPGRRGGRPSRFHSGSTYALFRFVPSHAIVPPQPFMRSCYVLVCDYFLSARFFGRFHLTCFSILIASTRRAPKSASRRWSMPIPSCSS